MALSRSIAIKILGDPASFERAAKKSAYQARKLKNDLGLAHKHAGLLGTSLRNLAIGGGVILGVRSLAQAITSIVDEAGHRETILAAEKAMLEAVGISYSKNAKHIDEVLTAQMRLSAFDDEDLAQSFTTLVRTTKDVNDALALNALATDIARATGKDLQSVAIVLGKVYAGNTVALKRWGIAVDKNATSEQILAMLQKRFAGQTEAYANTAQGSMAKMHVAVGEMKEAIGTGLLPVISQVAKYLGDAFMQPGVQKGAEHLGEVVGAKLSEAFRSLKKWISENKQGLKDFFTGAGHLAGILAHDLGLAFSGANKVAKALGGWKTVFPALIAGWAMLKGATLGYYVAARIGAIITAGTIKAALVSTGIGAVVVALGIAAELVIFHWDKVKQWFVDFKNWSQRNAPLIGALWGGPLGLAAGEVIKHWETVKDWFSRFELWVKEKAIRIGIEIAAPFAKLPRWLGGGWAKDMKKSLEGALIDMKNAAAIRGKEIGVAIGEAVVAGFGWGMKASGGLVADIAAQSVGGAATGVAKSALQFGPGSGITYTWAGSTPQTGYDCSGYVYDMYRRNGITIPRSSQAQFNDPNAIKVPRGQEKPGDAVYFASIASGANSGSPPRHVGIYIGSGNFIEYYSSGKPAKVTVLSSRKDYMGARRWLKIKSSSKGGASTTTPSASVPTAITGASSASSASSARGKVAPILPAKYELAIEKARGTQGYGDDLKAYAKALAYLRVELAHTDAAARKVQIQKKINEINKAIASIKAEQAKAKLKKIRDAFKEAFDKRIEAALKAFDKATDVHLKQMAKDLDRAMKAIDDMLDSQLARIDAKRAELTPHEAELKRLQDARAKSEIVDAVKDAQEALAKAQAGGDPEEIKSAQEALDDALYNQKIAALQELADAERALKDKAAEAETKAAQKNADDRKQALQDEYDAAVEAYENEREALRITLEEKLRDYEKYLASRNEKAQKAIKDMYDWLMAHPEYGVTPGDVQGSYYEPAGYSDVEAGRRQGAGNPDVREGWPQAAGGDYLVRSKTLFIAGEAGPERATFQPIGGTLRSPHGDIIVNVNLPPGAYYGDVEMAAAKLARPISAAIKRNQLVGRN